MKQLSLLAIVTSLSLSSSSFSQEKIEYTDKHFPKFESSFPDDRLISLKTSAVGYNYAFASNKTKDQLEKSLKNLGWRISWVPESNQEFKHFKASVSRHSGLPTSAIPTIIAIGNISHNSYDHLGVKVVLTAMRKGVRQDLATFKHMLTVTVKDKNWKAPTKK